MVELNEKALEAAHHAYQTHGQMGHLKAQRLSDSCLTAVITAYLSALLAPDDGLVERLRYRVENPSAWDAFDQGGSDLIAEAATALSAGVRVKITEEARTAFYEATEITREGSVRNLDAGLIAALSALSALYDAPVVTEDKQVQKLTAEVERLREALRSVISAETVPVHVGYDSGSGGGNFVYADAVRTDSDEFQAARSALTQEGER